MPSLRSWPHELLPGRCLPCSDRALNLLSVLKVGEEGRQPFLTPSTLRAGSGYCFLWLGGRWGQPTGGIMDLSDLATTIFRVQGSLWASEIPFALGFNKLLGFSLLSILEIYRLFKK